MTQFASNPSASHPPNHRGDILFAFALAAAGYIAWLAREVLLLLYVSALLAVVLTPVVQFVAKVRVWRWQPFKGFPVLVLLLAVAAGLTGFGFLAFPPVIRDLQSAGRQVPERLPDLVLKVINLPIFDQLNSAEIWTRVQSFFSTAATHLVLSIRNWAGDLLDIATSIVLTIYFIAEGHHAYAWFLSFFPPGRRERLDKALRRAEVRMGQWLLGQGSLMLILGMASTSIYALLGVRYPYALGVLTGLLNIIPVLGAAVSILLALIVAALDSWSRALGVGIFYVVYLWIENWFLTPRIMRSRVGLPSLAILVALLLGFALQGVAGALVAIPTAVLAAVLIDEYLVYKREEAEADSSPSPGH